MAMSSSDWWSFGKLQFTGGSRTLPAFYLATDYFRLHSIHMSIIYPVSSLLTSTSYRHIVCTL